MNFAIFSIVCLSNNWKNEEKLNKSVDNKLLVYCPNICLNVPKLDGKYSIPSLSSQDTTDTKSATKLGMSHLTKAEFPKMT